MLEVPHYLSLFQNANEGIIICNSRRQIVQINPAAESMFGYAEDELNGNEIEILIPERSRYAHIQYGNKFISHPANRKMGVGRDLAGKRKDGSVFPVEISLSYYEYDHQTYIIAFVIDITRRKNLENDIITQRNELEKITENMQLLNASLETKVEERTLILQEALQKLEESQKELSILLDKERQLNEIKSRFVSMASHEFRTPLSSILSSASLLANYTTTADQEKRDKHIRRIKNSVDHMNELLEDFLSLGRLNEGKVNIQPEKFNLKELLTDIIDEMHAVLKPRQHIELDCNGKAEAFTDKRLLRNILINLLSNASKFSAEEKAIRIHAEADENKIRVSIADEGVGIAEEDQAHLFSSFFRGANVLNIQGTGLGLHIVKRYVDLLKGTVRVESELDRGTNITFVLPQNKLHG